MKVIFITILTLFCIFLVLPAALYCQVNDPFPAHVLEKNNFPDYVYYRTNRESYNNLYYFILKEGNVYFKFNKHMTGRESAWQILPLHKKIRKPQSLSADDEFLVIIDENGHIFTMFHGLSDNPKDFQWTKRWGFPFWRGCSYKVTGEYLKWDISLISPLTDGYLQYPNGNKHGVGIGCTTLFLLNTDGRRITYIDPWLVNDLSNEITTPGRGNFKAVNMSTSGSTLFVINARGEMYTLLFDFDIAGMDTLFFNYSYHPEDWIYNKNPGKIVPRKVPRHLPIKGWVRQPPIPEKITDQISIIKQGKGALRRTLFVEGYQGNRTGYYTKDISDAHWVFVETGAAVTGTILDPSASDPGPEDTVDFFRYKGEITIQKKTYQVMIPDFNPYCFYSTIRFLLPGQLSADFIFHHNGKIRLRKRERGLSKKGLPMLGAIQGKGNGADDSNVMPVPESIQNHPDYLFLKDALGDFKEVTIKVTTRRFIIKGKKLKGKLEAY